MRAMNIDFLTLIKSRRAIRCYTDQPVAKAQIEILLEAARWGPSAHNRQPWRFAVLPQGADKERLAQAMGARLRADRQADGDDHHDIEADVARSYARITGAPVLILVCLSMQDMDSYSDETRSQHEWTMAVQSVSMAAQNMWLAAQTQGLAMCWLCAPLFVPHLVKDTLNLPLDWQPLGLMTLGYPAQTREKPRQPMAEKVLWL